MDMTPPEHVEPEYHGLWRGACEVLEGNEVCPTVPLDKLEPMLSSIESAQDVPK